MRTINTCLIIFLICIGLSKSFDFASLNEIQSLKQNTFASSLIETISLSLSSSKGEDANEVLKILNNLKSQLEIDQENDNKTFNAKNDEFKYHIAKLEAEISTLDRAIEALATRTAELSNLIEKAKENIESFEKRIVNLVQTHKEMKEIFENDSKYYKEKIEGLRKLQKKMIDVVNKLKELVGSVSGDKKYVHINATDFEKRDIAWKAAQKSLMQIKRNIPTTISSLLEISLNADQGALNKLIEILSKITGDIRSEIIDKHQYLENMTNSYLDLQKQMTEEITANKNALEKQQANKSAYENEKAEKEKEKASKEARKEALTTEKTINLELQTQLSSTYNKENQDRLKEITIVNVLIGIVEKRLVNKN
jgi:hypothetical protein